MYKMNLLFVLCLSSLSGIGQQSVNSKQIERTVEEVKSMKSFDELFKYKSECTGSSYEIAYSLRGQIKNNIGNLKDFENLKTEILSADRGKRIYFSVKYSCMGKIEDKTFSMVIKSK